MQNLASSGFSNWHFGHFIFDASGEIKEKLIGGLWEWTCSFGRGV
jgi:hypothetical protein